MSTGFSQAGRSVSGAVLSEHVSSGGQPGLVALVARHGEAHVLAPA
jgi:hypothetical protein